MKIAILSIALYLFGYFVGYMVSRKEKKNTIGYQIAPTDVGEALKNTLERDFAGKKITSIELTVNVSKN